MKMKLNKTIYSVSDNEHNNRVSGGRVWRLMFAERLGKLGKVLFG